MAEHDPEAVTRGRPKDGVADEMSRFPGVAIPEDAIDRYPSINLSALQNKRVFRGFTDVLDWAMGEVKSYYDGVT
jgi:hypothetical protein